MKTLLLAFIMVCHFSSFAQKSTNDLQVIYRLYFDDDRKVTYPAILCVKNNTTIYITKSSLSESWDGQFILEPPSNNIFERAKRDWYLKINHATKELLNFAPLPSNIALVTDNYPEIKWAVTNESKVVAGYNCTKATGIYRGREWAAWFTAEIALPYGPWKLHGLPGLILEVQSADAKYTMKAMKIEKAKSDIFNKDFKTLKPTYNKQPVTYQQHKKNEKEAFENMIAKARSEGENTTFVPAPPNGYELKYEWEE